MERALAWMKRRRNLVAALVALWALSKLVRWAVKTSWATRNLDGVHEDVGGFLTHNWPLLTLAVALFAIAVFLAARAGIARLPSRRP